MRGLLQRAAEIKENAGYRELSVRGAHYVLNRFDANAHRVRNSYWNATHGRGTSVLEYDWDNLVLLDACRYDEFVRQSPVPDRRVDTRITVGSKTPEFLARTFGGRTLHDTVYVTANPQVLKFEAGNESSCFHSVVSLLDEWDREVQTVRPEVVRERAVDVAREYPDKRIIAHFLQPHAPFLGETADGIRERTGKTIGGLDPGRDYTGVEPEDIDTASYHRAIREDGIDRKTIVEAYRESLAVALESASELVSELDGKSALTSDHGELLGERYFPTYRRQWGHPSGVRSDELCLVPWVEFPSDERKTVVSEPPEGTSVEDRTEIETRLRALGYR